MSTFDINNAAPGILRAESLNMNIKFTRTGQTTGRISWNIPTPAAGCNATDQAYCGMLVTIDTVPITIGKSPIGGTVYVADATADANLFAGDKIDTALIIGAFYNDRETTFFDIGGLQANTPYYVSGFPTDCQYRYFIEGVHAYSLDSTGISTQGTSGSQVVQLDTRTSVGVQLTDTTGLLSGLTHEFMIQLGVIPAPQSPTYLQECVPISPQHTIRVEGDKVNNYQLLMNEINKQLSLLDNPAQSFTPPDTGAFYWNATLQQLFIWDGYTHVLTPVIVQATQPDMPTIGTYWYNPTTNIITLWNGSVWGSVARINLGVDPTKPISNSSIWFTGTQGYIWDGVAWDSQTTFVQGTDPSLATNPPVGSYWYSTVALQLYKWNDLLDVWSTTSAIQYFENPSNLTTGAYWFNETNMSLFAWNTPSVGWNIQSNVAISETAPTTPAPGKFWYKPTTEQLFQRNGANTIWNELPVISFPVDPTNRTLTNVWWDTDNDMLSVWDDALQVWKPVSTFYQQSIDPTLPPTIVDGTLWFNTLTSVLNSWVVNCFKPTTYTAWPTDPNTTISIGTVWYNSTSKKWFVRSVGPVWTEIAPITSIADPSALPAGTYWFNTSNSSLQRWNGVAWVTVSYSANPLTPAVGTKWFNLTTNTLMVWNGTAWAQSTPRATLELNCYGSFVFTDTSKGSLSFVSVTNVSLFDSLDLPFAIHNPRPGVDGISETPSYLELGIGTDGSADERLRLMNEIRYDLGYPTIDVELTSQQLDFAITRALEELRSRTGVAYTNGYFFMQIVGNTQKYLLTNKIQGMNKIVTVTGVYRLTSSFLSSAHGAGVYGQIVLQHLYNMGTFDLLSYHIMAEYTELLELLLAARITFNWNEQRRELHMHKRFAHNERMVAIEASVERTEQDLMSDRWTRAWIRKWATAQSREMLAEIRGKFSTLPGAGGGIQLNAMELRQKATEDKLSCIEDIENYVVDKPEEYGVGTQFLFG